MPASFASIMYAFMGLPLIAIVFFTLVKDKLQDKFILTAGYIVGLVQAIAAIISIILLLQYNKGFINFSQFWNMSVNENAAYFSADVFSIVALFCVGMVTFASFYTAQTMIKDKAFNFANVMMILVLGMNGIALVTDLFSLYVFLEVTGIASYVLISVFRDNNGLEGGFKYLMMSAIASAFILGGLALLMTGSGSLKFVAVAEMFATWETVTNPILVMVSLAMLVIGFAIKSGLVPFHAWLPDAYQGAPAPVSIMLGGIVTKMAGVFALIRLLGDISISQPIVNTTLMVFALISIFYGAIAAVGQHDFKRILAYSSISQMGYIILAITCGSVIGYVGAILHFFNHATFKTTLFVNSAAVEQQTGTSNIDELGGLQKQMPVTGVSSILAFLSAAGIPPLAGFWSKLLIIIAVWQNFGAVIAILALVASIFTAAYFLRLQHSVFFGPVNEKWTEIKEAVKGFKLTEIALSVITVACGILFPVLLLILQSYGIL